MPAQGLFGCRWMWAVVLMGSSGLAADEAAKPRTKRIAVVPILNASGATALDATAQRAADVLVAGLTGKQDVAVLERRRVAQLVEELDFGRTALVTEPGTGKALGTRAKATHLVLGSLYRTGGEVRLSCRLVEVDRFLTERTATWTGAATALDGAAGDRLARTLLDLPLPEPENVRKARALYEEGRLLLKQGMAREAIEVLNRAVRLAPRDARLHVLLARCYAAGKRQDALAIAEATKAIELDRFSVEARLALGTIYLQAGKPAKAVGHLTMAVRLAPGDAAAHSFLARAHLERKHFDKAQASAERALEIDDKWADAHNVLGHCYALKGEGAKARAALERAVALLPDSAMFLGDLALWYEAAGHLDLAVARWEEALKLVPPKSERAGWIRRHLQGLRERLTPPDE